MLVAIAAGLVVLLAVLSIYYRWRVARDGLCVITDQAGRVEEWQFGPCP